MISLTHNSYLRDFVSHPNDQAQPRVFNATEHPSTSVTVRQALPLFLFFTSFL